MLLSTATIVMWVALRVVPVTSIGECPRGCSCGGIGTAERRCGGRVYRVSENGHAEADCQGLPLYCSSIPPLPTPAPLHLLQLINCSLPPGAAACLVRVLHSPSPKVLMMKSLVKEVGEGAFEGLEGVQEVIMMNAASQSTIPPLSTLSPLRLRVVEGTNLTNSLPPSLQSLEVLNSGEWSLTPAAFQGLNNLETLRICGNELEEVTLETTLSLSPRSLSSLPSLSSLSLTYSGVTSLPSSLLDGTHALVNVTFRGNRIEKISEDVFRNQSVLERLDLSRNSILEITPEIFRDLTALKELNLDHNQIVVLPDHIFSSLTHLTSLSISHNLLYVISSEAFYDFILEYLVLSHNLLYFPPPELIDWVFESEYYLGHRSPFHTLLELKVLDLSYNNISYVFSDWRYKPSLHFLDLSHNAITEINSFELQFEQTDLTVNLSYNQITSVNLPEPNSKPPHPNPPVILLDHNPYNCDCNLYPFLNAQTTLPNYRLNDARCDQPERLRDATLATLDLDSLICLLPDSPQNSCLVRPHRSRIECTGSDVKTLPNPLERGLQGLSLKLTNNIDFSQLPEYVTELNMSKLGLKKIIDVPKTVKSIDLSYNELNKLRLNVLEGNHTFFLKGNPILCDCWNSESVENLQDYKYKIKDFKYVECESGDSVGGVDASALCNTHGTTAIGLILAMLGIMLAILLATWRYSVEIRHYLSSIPGFEFLLDEEKFDMNKQYDIFVSFSHKDFPWIRDTLMPVLDKEYNVCVHYREWEVGQAIPAQIQRSVEQSRRTIVVLSNNFMESMWAVEEFRAACAQSARDNTTRAVVILLEKVNFTKLHEDLRNYLSLTTYLEAQDPKFWEKLKRTLPRHPANSNKLPGDPELGLPSVRVSSDLS